MRCNSMERKLWLSLAAGVIFLLSVPMQASAQLFDINEVSKRCGEVVSPDSGEHRVCMQCVAVAIATNAVSTDPNCKDYSSLNKPVAPKPVQATNPADIEKDVAELMAACDRGFAINCQCWEKEYRDSRANGLGKHEAQPTSQCYSKDRIKAYAYPRCARTQWKMIEQFESYCACVAEDFAASIIEIGETYENGAFLDAAKTCELSQQERLTPERGTERFEEYGRRGPTFDLQAYRKVP